MDWDDFFSKDSNIQLVERAVRRKLKRCSEHREEIVRDALSFVWTELLKDNKKRLQGYDPKMDEKGNGRAYVITVVLRIMRSYWTYRRGQFRFPASLIGERSNLEPKFYLLILNVYKMFCYYQLSVDHIVQRVKDLGTNEHVLKAAIAFILENYDHREKWNMPASINKGVELNNQQDLDFSQLESEQTGIEKVPDPSSNGDIVKHNIRFFFKYIFRGEPEENAENIMLYVSETIVTKMKKIRKKFKAKDIECQFLRMIHLDDLSISAAGREMSWSKDIAQGKHRRLWERLSRILSKEKEIFEELNPEDWN